MAIEVEVRSFISKEKYEELLEFFRNEGEFVSEDDQITHYFDCEQDLRIQKNNFFSKIWMKTGKVHDEFRDEIEIKFDPDDFAKLEMLYLALGYDVDIKWFRKRHTFKWQDVSVMVDFTKGYGHIIELEQMSSEKDKEKTLELLKQKLAALDIPLTPRDEFEQRYAHYRKNWRALINDSQ